MVKRIYAWQTDTAGCFYYRLYLPLMELQKYNIETSWGPAPEDPSQYDIVIGQRIAGYDHKWLDICKNPSVFAVYDIDDDLLNIDAENSVPYTIYAPLRDGTRQNIAAADLVTVSTPKLADYIATINSNVTILPNCIANDVPRKTVRRAQQFTIGWAGSMFHQQDWHSMPYHLEKLSQLVPHIGFHFIGADYSQHRVPSRVSNWSTIEDYYDRLDFWFGVAPISKTPFNDRKSWIKLLEYAAHGIPAVATAWGQYPEWIDHGKNGFLVHSESEWVDFMLAMTDEQLLTQMSTAAREKACEWTIENMIHRWAAAYAH